MLRTAAGGLFGVTSLGSAAEVAGSETGGGRALYVTRCHPPCPASKGADVRPWLISTVAFCGQIPPLSETGQQNQASIKLWWTEFEFVVVYLSDGLGATPTLVHGP